MHRLVRVRAQAARPRLHAQALSLRRETGMNIDTSRCRSGGTGRRAGLKIPCPKGLVGSIPSSGTKFSLQKAHQNPMRGIKLAAELGRRNRICSPEDYQRLIEAADFQVRVCIAIGYHVGMRLGEIVGLSWNRVDLSTTSGIRRSRTCAALRGS
jgi:integrase